MALNRRGVDNTVQKNTVAANSNSQAVAHPHLTRAPLLKEVPQQGFVLATVSGTHYIYTNINGVLLKTAFTPA